MYAGYDKLRNYQLYCSDPSGNYSAWKAHATGMNNVNAITILKSDFDEEITLRNALKLAVKVVAKTIDTHDPKPEKFEISYITKDENDKVVQKELSTEDLKTFLAELKEEAAKEEAAKK